MVRGRERRFRRWPLMLAASYVVAAVRYGQTPRAAERTVFTVVNDTGGEQRWLRVPQQLGTPWMLPAVGTIALLQGRRRDAMVALLSLPAIKATEVATKKLIDRPRPMYNQPTALRDDAPLDGGSFPSGHIAIAVAATVMLAPHLPRPMMLAQAGLTLASTYVRVHRCVVAVGPSQ